MMGKKVNKDNSQDNNLLLSSRSSTEIKEAYVKLRTNMMFCMTSDGSRNCRTFAISSPGNFDGKSVTAANVAISFAMLGKKTLLIDADMRSSSQRRLWKNRTLTGLCDFLAKIKPLEVFSVNDIPLSIVFTGTLPPNPSELLSTDKMADFVKECAGHYDYIIIDTPPLNNYADAQIISTFVDGIVLVAKSGGTKSADLQSSIDSVTRAGGNFCGVTVNCIKQNKSRFINLKGSSSKGK